jgi:hypothetical protein
VSAQREMRRPSGSAAFPRNALTCRQSCGCAEALAWL